MLPGFFRPQQGAYARSIVIALFCASLTACQGTRISYQDPGLKSGNFFACAANAPKSVPTPLQRLSKLQYTNTLRDLMATRFTSSSEVQQALDAVDGEISAFPPDNGGDFERLDARVGQEHVNAMTTVAGTLATWIASDSGRLARFTKNCSTSSNVNGCVESFIRDFGLHAFRRPLKDEEVQRFVSAFRSQGFAYVIARMLASPFFVYRVESQSSPDASDPASLLLSPYELASRLSYQLWDSMPDEELFAAAASGRILDETYYKNLVDTYFAGGSKTERVKPTFRRFFSEWLSLNDIPQIDPERSAAFAAFSNGLNVHASGTNLRTDMINEVLDLTDYYTWQEQGTLADLYLTKANFAKTDLLADIYGTSKWIPGETPHELSDPERAGIMTRAALALSGTDTTSPIHRGSIIRQRLLCDKIASPEAAGLDPGLIMPPEFDPTRSSRDRFAERTAPALCQGCHAQMNPLGFAMESLDSLGRVRSVEKVYDSSGRLAGSPSIDTRVEPAIASGESTLADGPAELSLAVAYSQKAQSCFARFYFRYVYRRTEDAATDGCALSKIRDTLQADAKSASNLRNVFKEAVLDPAFKRRMVPN